MQHYESIALCKDTSLKIGRFCTRSLASHIPRSVEDRSSWVFFIQVVHSCPSGRLQFSGGGSKMAWLASVFSSIRARCPKKVRRQDLVMDENGGWLVMRRMSDFWQSHANECPGFFIGTTGHLSTKLHLDRIFMLPMLYGSECWQLTSIHIHRALSGVFRSCLDGVW